MNEWSLSVVSDSLRHHGLQPTGSSVRGIFQARVLECVAISFSRGSSWPKDRTWVYCTAVRLFTIWATRETLAFQGIFLYLYLFYQESRHSAFRLTFFFVKFDSNWAFPLSFLEYHILFIWAAMIWDAWFTVTLLLQLSSLKV